MAKMGTPLFESGSMKESSILVCEKGNGPSSFRQIQRGPASTSCGRFAAEQTMESSSAVRVIEVKLPFVAQLGMGASGARRTMAYGPGTWRNLRRRRSVFLSSGLAARMVRNIDQNETSS